MQSQTKTLSLPTVSKAVALSTRVNTMREAFPPSFINKEKKYCTMLNSI